MKAEKRFNPAMLQLARLSREMTQGELAAALEVTQGRVSRIENGLREPTNELVKQFAQKLDYPTDFFYQDGGIQTLPITFFRKRKHIPRRTLDRIQADITIHMMNVERLLTSAEINADTHVPTADPGDVGGPYEVARYVRQVWGLPQGPIPNLTEVVERAGVVVVPCNFGVTGIDAIGMRHHTLPPMIFVNTMAPTDRMRFTLAHELGHLVMHDVPSEKMEDDANLFASEFLMPEHEIKPQLRGVTLPILATLKRVWRVSMAALLHRARQLRVISQRAYQSLWKMLTAYGYRRREPLDLDPPPEPPTLLFGLIEFHRSALRYKTDQLVRLFNLSARRFAELYEIQGHRLQLVG